ncbi:MAG: hypothetical protein GXY40_06725 [Syntrophomonadaceae bacterium]|jgi:hypothetical protein|nr:hypothetical protein [Syntrophomonadaceae bacterium]
MSHRIARISCKAMLYLASILKHDEPFLMEAIMSEFRSIVLVDFINLS